MSVNGRSASLRLQETSSSRSVVDPAPLLKLRAQAPAVLSALATVPSLLGAVDTARGLVLHSPSADRRPRLIRPRIPLDNSASSALQALQQRRRQWYLPADVARPSRESAPLSPAFDATALPSRKVLIRISSDHFRYTPVYIHSHSNNLRPSPSQPLVNSRSTPVYLRLNPGRHPDYDWMTSGYHPFISVLFRLNVPVFSGTLRPLSDFIRPFGR
ncbi:hypothetical protein K438DRAFT_2002039 [Mycena galopus ATCC 62051]|nr:hypothetical protein K438DRAFT_2002039 [Mycena galopus ATCC 62051]